VVDVFVYGKVAVMMDWIYCWFEATMHLLLLLAAAFDVSFSVS